jgi:hypothetical protein
MPIIRGNPPFLQRRRPIFLSKDQDSRALKARASTLSSQRNLAEAAAVPHGERKGNCPTTLLRIY